MMNSILNVVGDVNFDDTIIDFEWHSHKPYSSNSFKNSDEIRIPVHQQDIFTLTCESYLLLEGKIVKSSDGTDDTTTELISNAPAFFFEEIRLEFNGSEVDRVKNVGISTTMKNILTARPSDAHWMDNAGWNITDMTSRKEKTSFSFCVPLKLLLGFAEDYNKIILGVKQELILLRSSTDKNAIVQGAANVHDCRIELTNIVWRIPYVSVESSVKLSLLKIIERDQPIKIAFRKWQLFEFPVLPRNKFQTWTIKTSSMLEKPRYSTFGLQTNRKDNASKIASHFDFCDIQNIKLYLNGKYYPYDNYNGKKAIIYRDYCSFQSSYFDNSDNQPCLDKETYFAKTPLVVIDCSKQEDSLKTGSLDVRMEIETKEDVPENTAAYCLLISESLIEYTPLSGTVRKIM